MKTRLITLSSFVCLLGLMETQVCAAQPLLGALTRTETTIINDAIPLTLPLENGGNTELFISFSGGSRSFIIHFHAECSVKANDDSTSLRIAIVLDPRTPNGQVILPTGLDTNELCTSIKPNPGESPEHHRFSVGTSVLVSGPVQPGDHTIEVLGTINDFDPGEEALIDELSLVVLGFE